MDPESPWIRTGRMKRVGIFISNVIILLIVSFPLYAADIEIAAVVEKNILSVGESFIYQIQIQGSDNVSDFPKENWGDTEFTDSFKVEFLGGQNNSSRQIIIINGRRKEIINTAYIISWSLTPLKFGTLTIPSITVSIDGKKYTTRSIKIESKEAEESENLKLLVTLDKYSAYAGEPLLITFTWYIGMNITEFVYSIPFFQDKNFSFIDQENSNADPSSLVRFPVDGISVTAVQGKGTLKGKSYTTITFSKLVTPKTPGNFTIPKSVISVSAQSSRSGRGSDLFSSFFSSFQAEYQQFTVPSNDLTLKVVDLPLEGKPDNFNGYIGELNIKTSASPQNVRVGDPITFSMRISGPKNIADWDPPDLQKQYELAANFKMPSEISAGKIDGNSVVFTQTIRSLNDTVTQIPELEIPYFDTSKGIYSIASSQAIPITVARGSAVNVEGTTNIDSGDLQQEIVQSVNNGINFNYTDVKILKNQNFGLKILSQFPLILLLIIPPLFFMILLIITLSKKSNFFTIKSRSKNTLVEITKELKNIELKLEDPSKDHGKKVKLIFQSYMANKISADNGPITEKDVKNYPLIIEVFSLLDEMQFSGSFLQGKEQYLQIKNLINKILLAVEDFEGRIQ
jgi:BatD DUF11 like domain